MSKMYYTMGRLDKTLTLDDAVLSMFKAEGEYYSCADGFTDMEVNSFGPKTLHLVIRTLIASAKRWRSNLSAEEGLGPLYNATKRCMDALRIFEEAPASPLLKDRSVVAFPGYSLMGVLSILVKSGDISPPNPEQTPAEYEEDVAHKFVQETELHLYHHCRSLSLKADFLARNQKFDDALSAVEEMMVLYKPALHSKAISGEYAADHCGTVYSLSALWMYHLNRKDEALKRCDHIISWLLPAIDKGNMLNLALPLFPIVRVLKAEGEEGVERARDLYSSYVSSLTVRGTDMGWHKQNFRAISIILRCFSFADPLEYDGIDDDVAWILSGAITIVDWEDTVFIHYFSCSMYLLFAEVCVCLATRLDNSDQRKTPLVEKGLSLSKQAEPKMRDKGGSVTAPIAYSHHALVYSDLQSLSDLPV